MKKQEFSRIVKFCVGGGIGLGVYYIILYTLTEFANLWYPVSALIGSVLNYTISFLFQKYWTFENKEVKKIPKQIFLYFCMSASLTCANSIFLYLLVEYINLKYLIAQIILTIILSVMSYLITKKILQHKSATP